ncbi:MAG: DsbA family oxidoreductase [uncultured bacterium (gcode 4)]|uniref:DsbA family oxidoreductase n=1 Tax=uncultured bacterium (gcode 4) TaxID=1234023 RepID=K1YBT4_9BACT|nr:MAG: DsbA family oxidoreductase [uncultured bacterium (gcode 4)]
MKNLNPEESTQSCCSSPKANHPRKLVVLLLLVSIGASIGSSYFFSKQASKDVLDGYLALEYKKNGGKENYELVTEAQRLQLEQQLPQIREFVKKGASANPQAGGQESGAVTTPKKLSPDELTSIKKDAYIEGNKEAKITLVEYSDLECPFCIRQFKEGTIKKVHEKYGDKVNSIFKNFRGVPHENAEIEAVASLCAGQVGGVEKYAPYYQAILGRSNGGNGTGFSKDALVPLAKELGLDMKKFQACYDSKATLSRFDTETSEGRKLGVQGTPGTVVINNETGAYELIAGAYPVSEFERVIDKLLK